MTTEMMRTTLPLIGMPGVQTVTWSWDWVIITRPSGASTDRVYFRCRWLFHVTTWQGGDPVRPSDGWGHTFVPSPGPSATLYDGHIDTPSTDPMVILVLRSRAARKWGWGFSPRVYIVIHFTTKVIGTNHGVYHLVYTLHWGITMWVLYRG